MVAPVTATEKTLRAQVFDILRPSDPAPAARRWRKLHLAVLGIGLLAVILLLIDEMLSPHRAILRSAIWGVTLFFLGEYAARLCRWHRHSPQLADMSPTMARLRWATSLSGLIGLLAVTPAVMLAGGYSIMGADAASIFCILWIMKLGLHAPAFGTLGARDFQRTRADRQRSDRVRDPADVRGDRRPHRGARRPCLQQFGSLPNAMWWSVVTLTTTGYGDVVPLTPAGRIIGSALMISGIAVLALIDRRARHGLRAGGAAARISPRLGPGHARADLRVAGHRHPVRDRGQAAHALLPRPASPCCGAAIPAISMFFISSGEVEVRLPTGGTVRWATVPSSARCRCSIGNLVPPPSSPPRRTTLLVLYASDFYEIASAHSGPCRSRGERSKAPPRREYRAPIRRFEVNDR